VVCDEHGIGGDGDYCGDNDAQLGCINVFYHAASGGKYVLRAVLFGLEPGKINAVSLSRCSANSPLLKAYYFSLCPPSEGLLGLSLTRFVL
jgi:hypothetical protein